MHPAMLVKALSGIEPKTTLERFRAMSGIESRSMARNILGFLAAQNIGTIKNRTIEFSVHDRLNAAIVALQAGCDLERVSGCLTWRDFEKLAATVLASLGYKTRTNLHMSKPRLEIDVVGTSSGFAIAVDCKHWKRSNSYSMSLITRKQAARAERLVKGSFGISRAVPVIMTLHAESVEFDGGVPVVPVHKFKSFAMDVKSYLPEIYVAG